MHKIFRSEAEQEEGFSTETVGTCLWDVTHEHMQEWYQKINQKIKDY